MHAIIVGSGAVASSLASRLIEAHHTIAFVVEDALEAERIACDQPQALVIRGSSANEHTLVDALARDAAALYAVTQDDSHNMVAALLAKERFHIDRVVALARSCDDVSVFEALGIRSICEPQVVVDALVNGHESH